MAGFGISVLASPMLRSMTGFLLLTITALIFTFLLQFEQQAPTATDLVNFSALKSYGLALLLGATVMIDIAWFSAVVRVQAGENTGDTVPGEHA